MFRRNEILNLVINISMVILGFYIWFHPLDILILVALYVGIALSLLGSLYIIDYIANSKNKKRLLYGIVDLVAGITLIGSKNIVASSISIIFSLWMLFNSIIQIVTAIKLKMLNASFWIYSLFLGIIGILFSFIILKSTSNTGVITIAIIIGTYMIMYGIIETVEYFLLKDLGKIKAESSSK